MNKIALHRMYDQLLSNIRALSRDVLMFKTEGQLNTGQHLSEKEELLYQKVLKLDVVNLEIGTIENVSVSLKIVKDIEICPN